MLPNNLPYNTCRALLASKLAALTETDDTLDFARQPNLNELLQQDHDLTLAIKPSPTVEDMIQAIPQNIKHLDLSCNNLTLDNLKRILSYLPKNQIFITINLSYNNLHTYQHSMPITPLHFKAETIIFFDEELRKMSLSDLKIFSHIVPWGTEIVARSSDDENIDSNKISEFKQAIKSNHANETRFYDIALNYLVRKERLPTDAASLVAKYLHHQGGFKTSLPVSFYSKHFFAPPIACQETEQHDRTNRDDLIKKRDYYRANPDIVLALRIIAFAICLNYHCQRLEAAEITTKATIDSWMNNILFLVLGSLQISEPIIGLLFPQGYFEESEILKNNDYLKNSLYI